MELELNLELKTFEERLAHIEELVEKGKLTVDEGKELSEELKRNFTSSASDKMNKLNNKIDDIKPATKDEVRQIIEQYGFCYKGEYDLLQSKVDELEKKVEELEKNLKTNN